MFNVDDDPHHFEVTMIFITKQEEADGFRFMHGVLVGPIPESEFKPGVFTGYLGSSNGVVVVCERPRSIAGIGTTKGGLLVGQFESEQFGTREYTYRASPASVVVGIAANLVLLVTSSDLSGVRFPAFLTAQPAKATSIRARVQLAVKRIADLADVQAFASRNPCVNRDPEAAAQIEVGMTFPISIGSDENPSAGVIEIVRWLSADTVEVILHFSGEPTGVEAGGKLQRTLTIRHPASPNLRLRFSSEFGQLERWLELGTG